MCYVFFFFKQKTAYEMRISDWSSDVCSSDEQLRRRAGRRQRQTGRMAATRAGCGHLADAQARRTPMKVVILAGAYATRTAGESRFRPSPLGTEGPRVGKRGGRSG